MSVLRDPLRHVRRSTRRIRAELDEELAFHLEMRARELERAGYTPAAALAEARRRFADLGETQAICVAADERKERRMKRRDILDDLWQDVGFGLRQMRRRPSFALLAIATLAVGIGANTAIFSIADHILLRPLPYAQPERVLTVWETDTRTGETGLPTSPTDWNDWRQRTVSFAAWGLAEPYGFDLTEGTRPEPVRAFRVTPDWFRALGVVPALGRDFTAEDDATGAPVVILSHEFWQSRFAGDPALIGRTISMDDQAVTIIGVLPPGVAYPERTSAYAPLRLRPDAVGDRRSNYMFTVARLADGVAERAARAELDAVARHLSVEYPATNAATGIEAVPLRDQVLGPIRPALFVLLGAVGLLLLIACANVAGLLLARDADRAHEYAVRAALGAGPHRIGMQLLAENFVLALAAGVAGVAVAWIALRAFVRLAPAELPRVETVALDARILLFALGVTLLTTLLFGIVPALRATRTRADSALAGRGTAAGAAPQRLGRAIVVAEVALALVLLVGAGLLVRSFAALVATDVGFATENRVTLQVFLWDRNPTAEERRIRTAELSAALRATPGVRSVGVTSAAPFHPSRIDAMSSLRLVGSAEARPGEEQRVVTIVASPDYFPAIGMDVVRGRSFTEQDHANAPRVALVNETTARRYFGGRDPIGQRVSFGVMGPPAELEVVGIVRDTRAVRRDAAPAPEVFVPFAQYSTGSLTFVVETEPNAAALLPILQERVWDVDPHQAIYYAATVDDLIGATLAERRFHLSLLGSFSLVALVLAATGLYGVITFATARRMPELGVRLALGARPRDVIAIVVRDGVRLAVVGVTIGLVAAWFLSRLMTGMLYGVHAADPVTYINIGVLMLAVAALAAYVPARRAVARDPLRTLRRE
jgi:predicted permease